MRTALLILLLLPAHAAERPCMYDADADRHAECAHVSSGRCNHFAATCEPECWYDPKTEQHQPLNKIPP